ncbi:hypothetical protein OPQ81_001077 [Rhizoctonia solani]|nr:hypothetical protein OPQ81_001077 [Rhizoctonia solani]
MITHKSPLRTLMLCGRAAHLKRLGLQSYPADRQYALSLAGLFTPIDATCMASTVKRNVLRQLKLLRRGVLAFQ